MERGGGGRERRRRIGGGVRVALDPFQGVVVSLIKLQLDISLLTLATVTNKCP